MTTRGSPRYLGSTISNFARPAIAAVAVCGKVLGQMNFELVARSPFVARTEVVKIHGVGGHDGRG